MGGVKGACVQACVNRIVRGEKHTLASYCDETAVHLFLSDQIYRSH